METGYNPDGWLGIMMGTKFWVDMSNKEAIESNLQTLVRELKGRGKLKASESEDEGNKGG